MAVWSVLMNALPIRLRCVTVVLALPFAAGSAYCGEILEHLGISYAVPDGLLSARRMILDEETEDSVKEQLRVQMAQSEETVDILVVPPDGGEKGGMTIILEPVEDGDASNAEYMDGVFSTLQRYAGHIDTPATQTRVHPVSDNSYGFYRMDVENAYGTEGTKGSFLTRKIGDRYLTVVIITDGDNHSDRYGEVLKSLKVVSDADN